MSNKDIYHQLLRQADLSDLVAELHRRGYSYQPKASNKSMHQEEVSRIYLILIRYLLLIFILLGFALMGYLAYVSSRIG